MKTQKKHIKRLLKLADKLDSLTREEFAWDTWYKKFTSKIQENRHLCGTQACVLGWACDIPEFQDAGLKLLVSKSDDGYGNVTRHGVVRYKPVSSTEMGRCQKTHDEDYGFPSGKNFGGVAAGQLFFGLTRDEAENLFIPHGENQNPTPRQMASRVRKLAQKKLRQLERRVAA